MDPLLSKFLMSYSCLVTLLFLFKQCQALGAKTRKLLYVFFDQKCNANNHKKNKSIRHPCSSHCNCICVGFSIDMDVTLYLKRSISVLCGEIGHWSVGSELSMADLQVAWLHSCVYKSTRTEPVIFLPLHWTLSPTGHLKWTLWV